MTGTPEYEIYAIRYATRPGLRGEHFLEPSAAAVDPHDGPMPMDYFVWVIRGAGTLFVVDTGLSRPVAEKRGRTFLRCPAESLRLLGIDPDAVTDIIQTHLHHDHIGNFDKFPAARFHLTEKEMAYATGKYVKYSCCGHAYELEEVLGFVRLNYAGRVEFYDEPTDLADGVTLHPVGGHTPGLQVVRVHTRRGWVVLAADAAHYYENLEKRRPFRLAFHVGQMLDAFRTVERLASSPAHVIPGHDPLVMKRYPAPEPSLEGIVVRLD